MKLALFALVVFAACSDTHNLGNTTVFGARRWTLALGGADLDTARTVGFASDGDVIATGTFRRTVDFGGGTIATAGGSSDGIWISRRDGQNGLPRWTRTIGIEPGAYVGLGDAIVTGDDVVVAGLFRSSLALGTKTVSAVGDDVFVARYDRDGNVVWASTLGATSATGEPYALAADAQGNVYVTGNCQGFIPLADATLACTPQSPGYTSSYLASFTPSGALRWARVLPLSGDLAVGDTLILSGAITNKTVLDTTTLLPPQDPSGVVASFDRDRGALVWARVIGDPSIATEPGIVTALADGDVIVDAQVAANRGSLSVSRLSATGDERWRTAAPDGANERHALTMLPDETIVVGGRLIDNSIDFGTGPHIGTMYLAAYDHDGTFQDVATYGAPGRDGAVTGLAGSPSGAVAFVGQTDQPIDFGLGAITIAGGTDAVIGVIDPP